jgi:valyl-tRNA synthetase
MIKPPYGDPIPEKILKKSKNVMSDLMIMLHPFTPFITEELWQNLNNHPNIGFINQQSWPDKAPTSFESAYFQPAMQLVSQVRAFRNEKNISPKIPATIYLQTGDSQKYIDYKGVIQKLSGSIDIHFDTKAAGFVALLGTDEVTVTFEGISLTEKQDPALLEAEIQRLEQFLQSVQKKLENVKFVQNAQADVVERERQKLHDTELKIQSLKAELAQTL